MKKITTYLFFFTALLLTGQLLSQTITNVEALNRMSQEFEDAWKEKEARVIEYCKRFRSGDWPYLGSSDGKLPAS